MNLGTEGKPEIRVLTNNFFDKLLVKLSLKPKEAMDVCTTETDVNLIESIKNARIEWVSANMNFEHATDKEMIDYYTYQIKACEVRYQHLLREAKEKGIKV